MARSVALRQIAGPAKVVELTPGAGTPGNEQQLSLAIVAAPEGPNLSERDRAEAERRLAAIEPLIDARKFPILQAQYPSRMAMQAYLSTAHGIPVRTIQRWLTAWKRGGLAALVNKDRSDKGKPRVFNAAALELLLRASLPQRGVVGPLTGREIFRLYEEERAWRAANAGKALTAFGLEKYARYADEDGCLRPSALLPKASYRTFLNWIDKIPELARTMARDGEEAFRNTQEVLSFRSYTELEPLEYVVMDHRVLDLFCLMPDKKTGWRLARPWLTAAIDMRTRKWLGWVIVEVPSSDSIAAVLKQVFLDYGVPKAVYWDNGKDFRCEWLEGRDVKGEDRAKISEMDTAWRGVLGTLGVRVHHAIVKNARAKLIEPNFGRVSDFDRTLPEWCGNKPHMRPGFYEELVAQHEQWMRGEATETPFRTIYQVSDLYSRVLADLNDRPLQGEGMKKSAPSGMTWYCPGELFDILIRRVAKREISLDLLQFCFAKRKRLTVKHSEVQTTIDGQMYHYRIRANDRQVLARLNGCEVEMAYDPLDLGEAVIYYQGRCVGLADCVALRRMGEDAFRQDERDRRALRRDTKALIQMVHQAVPILTPEERLARREAVRPARIEPQRPALPAAVPAAIAAAAELAREEKDFDFEAVPEAAVQAAQPAEPNEDDEFRFFGN